MSRLVRIAYQNEIPAEGLAVVKEAYDRVFVLARCQNDFECYEIPDASSYGSSDAPSKLAAIPGAKRIAVHKDAKDADERGQLLWIWMSDGNTPLKAAPPAKNPAGYSMDAAAAGPAATGEPPSPLIPFAGLDRKPMPPSPAKPFSPQASPLKPSPLKERIDTATQAVAQKHWTQKQSKMNALFGSAAAKPPQPPQQHQQEAKEQVQPLRAVIANPDAMDA